MVSGLLTVAAVFQDYPWIYWHMMEPFSYPWPSLEFVSSVYHWTQNCCIWEQVWVVWSEFVSEDLSWFRFIDDIDMKWIHGRETLEAFLETANSFHSTIRFTAEVSNDKHVFLDTMSHLADDKVAVDLYTKPSDSHQYLLSTSCHPPHCSKNIPYSLELRIRRICSDDETYFNHFWILLLDPVLPGRYFFFFFFFIAKF